MGSTGRNNRPSWRPNYKGPTQDFSNLSADIVGKTGISLPLRLQSFPVTAMAEVEANPADPMAAVAIKFLRLIIRICYSKDSTLDIQMEIKPDSKELLELAHYKMPYGKYKGRYLVDLPLPYLVWFQQKGFPEGKLGKFLNIMLTIKDNNLEPIIRKLQKEFPRQSS